METKSKLLEQGQFTKVFELNDVKLFIHKGVMEENEEKRYFLIHNIPIIPELNVERIELPVNCEDENEMNESFDNLDCAYADFFINGIIEQIRIQKEQVDKEQIDNQQNN
jgi:hypothetical protein